MESAVSTGCYRSNERSLTAPHKIFSGGSQVRHLAIFSMINGYCYVFHQPLRTFYFNLSPELQYAQGFLVSEGI